MKITKLPKIRQNRSVFIECSRISNANLAIITYQSISNLHRVILGKKAYDYENSDLLCDLN